MKCKPLPLEPGVYETYIVRQTPDQEGLRMEHRKVTDLTGSLEIRLPNGLVFSITVVDKDGIIIRARSDAGRDQIVIFPEAANVVRVSTAV